MQAGPTQSGQAEAERRARRAWLRALERTAPLARDPLLTLPVIVERQAARLGDAVALLDGPRSWSYRDLATAANRYARWAMAQGVRPGQAVALILPNGAEYVAAWLGISRIGGVAALVNPHLVGEPLRHALAVAQPGHVVTDPDLMDRIRPCLPNGGNRPALWTLGEAAGAMGLDTAAYLHHPIDAQERPLPRGADLALLIYTSGTTGLPKAARVSHRKAAEWGLWFAGMMDVQPSDRMFNCLPMHHSTGGVSAVGAMLAGGGSTLIRPRFSATAFWDEVAEGGCTLFQYIGELCRYLVNAPPHPLETAHRLRLCCGNGLTATVWERFQRRFRIPHILEFYAATEGVVSLYNCEGRPGAVGRVPPYLPQRATLALARYDPATATLLRNGAGRCQRCAPGEAGELLAARTEAFESYAGSPAAGAGRIARDVFEPGDAWFRTGDALRQDADGFYFFVDRLGDTFRWKAENVASAEVADALGTCPGVRQAAVYGVAVPGAEGRAGMAAIEVKDFDPASFHAHACARLPDYAVPVFLRLCERLDATGTFKPRKAELQREAFGFEIADPLYVRDRAGRRYVPLDPTLRAAITAGTWRF